MTLKEYYKTHVYEYAYNKGYDDALKGTPNPTGDQRDIYWKDEMDFFLCSDYISLFLGGIEDLTEEDENFMYGLGFVPEDFLPEEDDPQARAEEEWERREQR